VNQKLISRLKPGFHSNARNARKALRKEKYASKIKNAQETQQTQIMQAKKNKSTQAQVTQRSLCNVQENAMIELILFFTQRTQHTHRTQQALALRAFEWKPGFGQFSLPQSTTRTKQTRIIKKQTENRWAVQSWETY